MCPSNSKEVGLLVIHSYRPNQDSGFSLSSTTLFYAIPKDWESKYPQGLNQNWWKPHTVGLFDTVPDSYWYSMRRRTSEEISPKRQNIWDLGSINLCERGPFIPSLLHYDMGRKWGQRGHWAEHLPPNSIYGEQIDNNWDEGKEVPGCLTAEESPQRGYCGKKDPKPCASFEWHQDGIQSS